MKNCGTTNNKYAQSNDAYDQCLDYDEEHPTCEATNKNAPAKDVVEIHSQSCWQNCSSQRRCWEWSSQRRCSWPGQGRNNEETRVAASICFMHIGNATDTVIMYDLVTRVALRCDRFTVEPMPNTTVRTLRTLANSDKPRNLRKRPPAWMLGANDMIDVPKFDDDNGIRKTMQVPNQRVEPNMPAEIDADARMDVIQELQPRYCCYQRTNRQCTIGFEPTIPAG